MCEGASDTDLMLRCKAGDDAAFAILVERHKSRILNTVYRFLGDTNEAEDLAQDVFLGLHRSVRGYEPRAKFTTFLYRLVANRCMNVSRRRKVLRFLSLESVLPGSGREDRLADRVPEPRAGPEAAAQRGQVSRIVNEAVASLPDRQRLAMILRHYNGMSYDEIGAALSLSASAVKSVIHRAALSLRNRLTDRLA